jgi:exopolysaccharide biosynthesis polyprenyl glycosylphosphotransferase
VTEDLMQGGGVDKGVPLVELPAVAADPVLLPSAELGAARRDVPKDVSRRLAWVHRYQREAVCLDILSASVAVLLGLLIWEGTPQLTWRGSVVALALPPVWVTVLALSRGYSRRYIGTTTEEYRTISRAALTIFVLIAMATYLAHFQLARRYVLLVVPLMFVLTMLSRHALRARLVRRRARGIDVLRTVVIGDTASVEMTIREIHRATWHEMHVVAACVSDLRTTDESRSTVEGVPVFGYPEEALTTVDLLDADVVAVASDRDLSGPSLRRLAWSLEEREVDLVVSPGLLGVAGPRLSIRPAAGMPLLLIERPVRSGARRLVKILVDRGLTAAMLVVGMPVMLLIALAIRLDSTGPVLFRQKRVGARGEEFEMVKFRTMCVDAEDRLATLQRDAGNTVLFKMRSDPRVTRVGRVLRRFSLDELPQLFNVLRGEMSLVGPRPPLLREVEDYEPDAARRLRVRPGLTGLWQVSGRSDLTWDESLRLDLWYVDNWCLTLDLQILFRTAKAVVKGCGAY